MDEHTFFSDLETPVVDWFDVATNPLKLAEAIEAINTALAELRRENAALRSRVNGLESHLDRPASGDWVI